MKLLISSATPSSLCHCSWYNVTGKRPSPYTDTAPFSLTFIDTEVFRFFFRASFSALNRSNSCCTLSSDMSCLFSQNFLHAGARFHAVRVSCDLHRKHGHRTSFAAYHRKTHLVTGLLGTQHMH